MKFFKKEKLIMIFAIAVLLLSGFNFSYAATPAYGGPDVSLYDSGHQYSIKQNADNSYTATDLTNGSVYKISIAEFQALDDNGQIKGSVDSQGRDASGALNDRPGVITSDNEGACLSGRVFMSIDIYNCIKQLLYIILWLVSFVVSIFGWVFNVVFDKTVRNIADTIKDMVIIKQGWTVVRDLCNIGFIFILLWLSISTILGLNEHGVKHALSRVIIAAVLINFSLMFTQMVIDIPNMLSVTIYDKTVQCADGDWSCGLGSAVFNVINPEEKVSGAGALEGSVNGAPNNPTSNTAFPNDAQRQQFARNGGITTFVMMLILYSTTLFVFFASIIIFIKRFIILLFLMIFSPLAYLGMAVPIHSLQHEAEHKFWNTLVKEAFYAPIFMLCVNVSLNVGQALFKNNANGGFGETVFGFSVVIIMMIASLLIAEEMGVSGAGGAMTAFQGMSQGAAGWVGTNTVGKYAYNKLNKEPLGATLFKMASSDSKITRAVGRFGVTSLDKFSGSYKEQSEKNEKWKKTQEEELHGDPRERVRQMIESISNTEGRNTMDQRRHHVSDKEVAEEQYVMDEMIKGLKDKATAGTITKSEKQRLEDLEAARARWTTAEEYTYNGTHGHGLLSSDLDNKVQRARYGELDSHNNKFREILSSPKADNIKAREIEEFIKKSSSEAAVVGAIRSLGRTANVLKGNTVLKNAISRGVRSKFNGEGAFVALSKDPISDTEIKAAVAEGGYETKMTADIYDLLTDATQSVRAKADANITNRFKDLLKNSGNDRLESVATTGTIDNMITEYAKEVGNDRANQNYFSKDNAKRSQPRSAKVEQEMVAHQNMFQTYVAGGYRPRYDLNN